MGMEHQKISKATLLLIAVLGWFALIAQFYLMINSKVNPLAETIIRFFSYFTIDTNLLVALCCSILLLAPRSAAGRFFSRQSTQAAIAIYIMIVGIVYNIILRHIWNPQGLQLVVDELLHLIIPILFFVYWLIFVPKDSLEWKHAFNWMLYPSIYGTFALLRGNASGFYPYPFIDMSVLGLNKTLINVAGFVFIFLLAGLLFIAIGKWMSKKQPN